MSTLIEAIAKALAETNELLKTIEGMKDGNLKEQYKKQAQKLKGYLLKELVDLVKESNRHEC